MKDLKYRLEIHYCPKCRWLPRACWMAQELLTTFEDELDEIALVPAEPGIFKIVLDDKALFDRKAEGRFPEPKEIKQKIRDTVAPERDLGHSDRG